MPYNY